MAEQRPAQHVGVQSTARLGSQRRREDAQMSVCPMHLRGLRMSRVGERFWDRYENRDIAECRVRGLPEPPAEFCHHPLVLQEQENTQDLV